MSLSPDPIKLAQSEVKKEETNKTALFLHRSRAVQTHAYVSGTQQITETSQRPHTHTHHMRARANCRVKGEEEGCIQPYPSNNHKVGTFSGPCHAFRQKFINRQRKDKHTAPRTMGCRENGAQCMRSAEESTHHFNDSTRAHRRILTSLT